MVTFNLAWGGGWRGVGGGGEADIRVCEGYIPYYGYTCQRSGE